MSQADQDTAARLGARHLDPSGTGAPKDLFKQTKAKARVRLSVSNAAAATTSGQHLAWMAVNLLARQFDVINTLEIVAPDLRRLQPVAAFERADDLLTTLTATAVAVAGDAMDIVACHDPAQPSAIVVAVGANAPVGEATDVIWVAASGWTAAAWRDPTQLPAQAEQMAAFRPSAAVNSANATGAYLAACWGAGEVFKRALDVDEQRGRYIQALIVSTWDLSTGPDALIERPWTADLTIDDVYLVGAGAVAQGLIAALLGSAVAGTVVTIDHDVIDDPNLNRYILAILTSLGAVKVRLMEERAAGTALSVIGYAGRWQDYPDALDKPARPAHLAKAEATYRYRRVISAVDKNPARHAIQKYWPQQLWGGSTYGLTALVCEYDMDGPDECLMCANPIAPTTTIEKVTAWLAALPGPQLEMLAQQHGADPARLAAYLLEPGCGRLGDLDIGRFSDAEAAHDYAVGFVSVAAGVLLAAQQIRLAFEATTVWHDGRGAAVRLSFSHGEVGRAQQRRRPTCECTDTGRVNYRDLWGH